MYLEFNRNCTYVQCRLRLILALVHAWVSRLPVLTSQCIVYSNYCLSGTSNSKNLGQCLTALSAPVNASDDVIFCVSVTGRDAAVPKRCYRSPGYGHYAHRRSAGIMFFCETWTYAVSSDSATVRLTYLGICWKMCQNHVRICAKDCAAEPWGRSAE